MPTTYNVLGSQNVNGSNQEDRFYAFTYDANLDHVRADATIASLSWTTSIRTSATTFLTLTGSNVQISSDFFAGGEKNDFIYGSNLNDALFYNNGVISGGIGSFSSIEQIELGAGDDIIDLSAHGASGIDYAKNIIIHGDDGNDTIIGGAGMDTLYGDGGDDLIFGYRGADTIYGGAGNDILYGDDLGFNNIAGDDILYGGAGNDILYGGARTDRLEGGDGNDILYGGTGGDNLLGGTGDDILYGDDAGANGNDRLEGDAGNDQLYGGGGNDEMRGGTGNDLVEGGDGNDFVDGDGGVDILVGGAGDDILNGGTESDTAVFSGSSLNYTIVLNADGSFTVSDTRPGSPDGTDTIRNVEFFQFTDGTFPAGVINHPPVITSDGGGASASLSVAENQIAVTTVTATDPDNGQVLTYSIAGGADAALFTIDPATGVLTFINAPDFENPGDAGANNVYDVIVRATDNIGAFDDQALSISVTDVSDGSAPVITSDGGGATATINIGENTTAVTIVAAIDPDGTTPTYSIVGGADAALFSIDAQTGALVFISAPDFENPADFGQNNVYDVIVQASDGTNIDQQNIAVTVGNANDNVPVITSGGGGATASVGIAENILAVTTVTASDADGGPLTYSIVGGSDAALFSINAQTGALLFITAPDFEVPGDFNGDNIYDVIVQVSDGTNTDQQQIAVTVANANDNSPVITSNGGGTTAAISIDENSTTVTVVAAIDADGTMPTYSIVGGADAALFSINAQTGALVFLSAPDFELPTDFNADNVYDVIVQASDGTNVDQQQIAVTVGNLNDVTPTITSNGGAATASVNIIENSVAVTTVTSTDADGPAAVYSIIGGADAALFSINAQTGALVFNSAPDFELPADFNADNVYDVIVQVSDGTYVDQQQIAVTVGNANDNAPVITSGGGGASAAFSVAENTLAVTTILASDLDGSTITYSIVGGADAAFFTINPQTGALSFIASRDFETPMDAGLNNIYDVIIRASDGTNFDDQTLAITVTDVAETGRTITGTSGNNTISPTATNTALQTTSLNDTIYALAGDDIIDGGLGADRMEGGVGNDIYYVDQYSEDGNSSNDDLVIEAAGAGTDLVNSLLSYRLSSNVENLTLIGIAAINGIGNELNNVIRGNDAANILDGGLGNDTIIAGGGADTLIGGDGNDSLDGGAGADSMDGGTGNDTYFIDTFSIDGVSSNDDLVIELAGGGTDIVNSSVTYILTDNVENLTLTGTAAIDGTGNGLDNVLKGNSGDNSLYGLAGADTLNGNAGIDRLYGGDGNDTISGGSESDFLYGEAGNDTLLGGSENDYLDGGAGADTLNGQAGSDIIIGGLGKDVLTGGAGDNDSFVFGLNDSTTSGSSCDVINDFETGFDTIRLTFSTPNFPFTYSESAIGTSSFSDAFAAAQAAASTGTDVVFVAGATDGWLFWDTNNDGVIDQSIVLKGLNSLNSFDYNYIIA